MEGAKQPEFQCRETNCWRVFDSNELLSEHYRRRHSKDSPLDEQSTEYGTMMNEIDDMNNLRDSIMLMASDLRNERSDPEDEYVQALVRLELEDNKQRKLNAVTSRDVVESRKWLTNDRVLARAAEIELNEGVRSLELVEHLCLKGQGLAFFDESEMFSLSKMIMLRELDLSGNHLTSLTGVGTLIGLEGLKVCDNQIGCLIGVQECGHLQKFFANRNQIDSIYELRDLKKLRVVELAENNLKNFEKVLSVVQDLPKLKELSLKGHIVFERVISFHGYRITNTTF
jgi:Leucine-rich repeat (LRR) protein